MHTKSTIRVAAGVLVASAAFAFGAYAAEPAGHHHEAAGLAALKLNAGQKWATDAPLRKGMEEIRNAIAANKDAIHAGKLTPAKYGALADRIDAQVAYVVQNCKLAPEADAQLHAVIGEMMEGTEAARGKVRKVGRHAGVDKVVAALDAYGRYFDHPGWRGPE